MLARLQITLEKRARAGIIHKFINTRDFHIVAQSPLDHRARGGAIAFDALDGAAVEVVATALLREPADFLADLFGQITHRLMRRAGSASIKGPRVAHPYRLTDRQCPCKKN